MGLGVLGWLIEACAQLLPILELDKIQEPHLYILEQGLLRISEIEILG